MEQNKKEQKNGKGLLWAILICTIATFICNFFAYRNYEKELNEVKEQISFTEIEDTIDSDETLVDTVYFVGYDSTENVE